MSYFPLILPNNIEITSISRTQTAVNTCFAPNPAAPIPIDISTGTYNMYIVTGLNLNKIVSATWFPAKRSQIVFKMVPWQTYSPASGDATFGIIVQDQETFDYQRGGNISFRDKDGNTVSIPAATFASYPWLFNPTEIPLQGWDTGAQSEGGAY